MKTTIPRRQTWPYPTSLGKTYSVGCKEIDDQHKKIIGIINDLYETMQTGNEAVTMKNLTDRLYEYTVEHFSQEEKLLESNHYPDLFNHKTIHDRMAQKTKEMQRNYGHTSARELLHFLKQWWVNHISSQDKSYAPYLESASKEAVGV